MMCIIYACDHEPVGVKSFILSSTLTHSSIWAEEHHRRMKYLSEETQKAIAESVVNNRALNAVKNAVLEIDDKAFITITSVNEIKGNGFTKYMRDQVYVTDPEKKSRGKHKIISTQA